MPDSIAKNAAAATAKPAAKINGAANVIWLKASFTALIEKEEETGLYVAICPALPACSQGKTFAEAKKNIAESIELLIEYCVEEGILNEVLQQHGFRPMVALNGKPRAAKPPATSTAKTRRVQIPAEVPVMYVRLNAKIAGGQRKAAD